MTELPRPTQWIHVTHLCEGMRVHSAPVQVRYIHATTDDAHCIVTTRCDGRVMNVYTDEDDYTIVPKPAEADAS